MNNTVGQRRLRILCVGEMLWDLLPSGQFAGGAPFNVAAHLARLGHAPRLLTAVGADTLGREAIRLAGSLGVDVALVQTRTALPTGEARAQLDQTGSARYVFNDPAAWDAIESTSAAAAAAHQADAIVFGTLAQRHPDSRRTIRALTEVAAFRVFDPNLRAPHIDRDATLHGLLCADLIKLNEDECAAIAVWLEVPDSREAILDTLCARRTRAPQLCITRGERGAELFDGERWHRQPAPPTHVRDTVGAGDSFLAMLLAQRLTGTAAQDALRRAATLASFVASQPGAVPDYDASVFQNA
jgi:fructokinase